MCVRFCCSHCSVRHRHRLTALKLVPARKHPEWRAPGAAPPCQRRASWKLMVGEAAGLWLLLQPLLRVLLMAVSSMLCSSQGCDGITDACQFDARALSPGAAPPGAASRGGTAKFANTLLATPLASPGKGKHVLLARRFERFPGCSLRCLLHCRRERNRIFGVIRFARFPGPKGALGPF